MRKITTDEWHLENLGNWGDPTRSSSIPPFEARLVFTPGSIIKSLLHRMECCGWEKEGRSRMDSFDWS